MSAVIGRTGANVRHLQHAGNKQTGNSRADRASLLHESMRDLDSDAADIHAAINPNIVRGDTHLNLAMVNDGDGAFRRPKSTEEVLDYGDGRIGNVFRKWKPTSFETTLIVMHLPKTMCEEVADFYPILDSETGDPVLNAETGEPMMRSRWVARDSVEAIRYFEAALGYYADEVLTGGIDAIHGYDINFDESTPHIQIMADTLAPDPKHEGQLRVDAGRMWGTHRDVTEVRRDAHGIDRPMIEPPATKMARYAKGLRERMHSLGFPVELDYDPERHLAGQGKAEFTETLDARRETGELAAQVERVAAANEKRAVTLKEYKAMLDLDAKDLDAREAALPELRRRAKADGLADARAEAQIEVAAERAAAARERVEAQQAVNAAMVAQVATQRALGEAEGERDRLRAEVDRQAVVPSYLNRYLDQKTKDGQTLRPHHDRWLKRDRANRADAQRLIDSSDTTRQTGNVGPTR